MVDYYLPPRRATTQMAAGSVSDLRPIFEEYLGKWRYTSDGAYVLKREQYNTSNVFSITVMSSEQYFEVAELYTVTFLSIVSQQSETAISWAEKAELSEQNHEVYFFSAYFIRILMTVYRT
jgi:hypothetical protein